MIDRRRRPFDTRRLFITMRDETDSARKSLFHLKGTVSRAAGQTWNTQRQLARTFLAKWIWRAPDARRMCRMHVTRFPGKPERAFFQNTDKPNPTNGEIMKTHLLNKLPFLCSAFAVLLGIATTAYGGVPSLNVTVFDADGKIAFKGPTSANATFAARNLQPGTYVVQFNTRSAAVKNNEYLLVVSAGKKKVIAADVPGEKFTTGGVAMRVDVPGSEITGQVATEQAVAQGDGAKFRVIDGKRYLWVNSEFGTNRGGHWMEEGLPKARNITILSTEDIQKKQDRAGEGSQLGYLQAHTRGRY
jgi:hypothetical protein